MGQKWEDSVPVLTQAQLEWSQPALAVFAPVNGHVRFRDSCPSPLPKLLPLNSGRTGTGVPPSPVRRPTRLDSHGPGSILSVARGEADDAGRCTCDARGLGLADAGAGSVGILLKFFPTKRVEREFTAI